MKLRTVAASALLALLVVPAFAQKGGTKMPMGKPMAKPPMSKPMMEKSSVSGIVKGKPMGKMFMMGSRKGEFKVDTSKAKIRMNGKFFSVSNLAGGDMVTVMGMMKGKEIMADAVEVTHKKMSKPMSTAKSMPVPKKG